MRRKNTQTEYENLLNVRARNPNKLIYFNCPDHKYKEGWCFAKIGALRDFYIDMLFYTLKRPNTKMKMSEYKL